MNDRLTLPEAELEIERLRELVTELISDKTELEGCLASAREKLWKWMAKYGDEM